MWNGYANRCHSSMVALTVAMCTADCQSIKVLYPSFERGQPYKRIFDMLIRLVPYGLGPVSICLTILLGRLSIVYAARLSSEAWHTWHDVFLE